MDPDISFKEAKSLVCLSCGNYINIFGPEEVVLNFDP